jgi:hypothetical protein
MPEITIYTSTTGGDNGVAEISPFTVGDATNDWTLKFHDGDDYYSPSGVTMKAGHTVGLPDGTYNNAFKWIDRAGHESVASISITSGVPTVTFDTDPLGGVTGTDGAYILRGPQLDGSISSISIEDVGYRDSPGGFANYPSSWGLMIDGTCLYPTKTLTSQDTDVTVNPNPSSTTFCVASFASSNTNSSGGEVTSVTIYNPGAGFASEPTVTIYTPKLDGYYDDAGSRRPQFRAHGNWAKYAIPFKRDESGNNIIGATTLSPYSDGKIEGTAVYDHSTLVVRPENVATASLSQSGDDWVGTMNPINSYVSSVLSLRSSMQLDLQVYGDGKMLFQGQLTILAKID